MDFSVTNQGSVIGITPLTDAASEWIDDNVHSEGWQWMGSTLYVDARFADALVEGMMADGLEMEGADA